VWIRVGGVPALVGWATGSWCHRWLGSLAVEGLVRPVVVEVVEPVQLRLQFGQRLGGRLPGQPASESAVEPFPFPAGLRVMEARRDHPDAQRVEVGWR
jgi:hypothetical protein